MDARPLIAVEPADHPLQRPIALAEQAHFLREPFGLLFAQKTPGAGVEEVRHEVRGAVIRKTGLPRLIGGDGREDRRTQVIGHRCTAEPETLIEGFGQHAPLIEGTIHRHSLEGIVDHRVARLDRCPGGTRSDECSARPLA